MTKLNKTKVMKALEKIIDPEIGIPIVKMKLIDKVSVKDGNVEVTFHLTTPFCPFSMRIAEDIKQAVSSVPGVKKVKVKVQDNF